jgi:hypothetical protein
MNMGARNELNTFHIMGSLGVAGILGLATGSVAVFVIAGAALIGAALYTGEIRPRSGGPRQDGRRRPRPDDR